MPYYTILVVVNKEIEEFKFELEKEYGSVNIDLANRRIF